MAITPMSTSGNFEDALGETCSVIIQGMREIIGPIIHSSYWMQRCQEGIKHGVFYCVTFRNGKLHLSAMPFWATMPKDMKNKIEQYLSGLSLKDNLIICALYAPVYRSLEESGFETHIMLLQSQKVHAGLFKDSTADLTLNAVDLPDGMKILSQDLASFFAHL